MGNVSSIALSAPVPTALQVSFGRSNHNLDSISLEALGPIARTSPSSIG